MEGDHPAGRGEVTRLTRRGPGVDLDRDAAALGVLHLRRDGPHPDQLVEPVLAAAQAGLRRGLEDLAGRSDRLVRLLGVLHLGGVDPRLVRQVRRAVQLADLGPGRGDRGVGQRDRVGPHIGDVAVLVQPLRDLHRLRGGHAQLAAGLLLQRGGPERRIRLAGVRLGLDRPDGELRGPEVRRQRGRGRSSRWTVLPFFSSPLGAKSRPCATRAPSTATSRDGNMPGLAALAGVERGVQVPVRRAAERDPLALAVHHHPGGDRLDPARRQLRHDLLPEHRRDLVAVQPVQDAAGLLRVDEVVVDVPRVADGVLDGLRGDLVEHHPLDRDLRLQLVQQVPGDRLALAVLVCGQVELVGALEQILQLADLRLLVRRHDVQRVEVVLDVDAEPRPGLTLVLRRDLVGTLRQVADVAETGLHHVPGPRGSRRSSAPSSATRRSPGADSRPRSLPWSLLPLPLRSLLENHWCCPQHVQPDCLFPRALTDNQGTE